MSKKYKILLIILVILIIVCLGLLIVKKYVYDKDTKKNSVTPAVVDNMEKYGYALEDRDTKLYKNVYYELKEVLDNDEVDYEKYGEKIYKLPINLPITCPNRINGSGCSFCADVGTGFEAMESTVPVSTQLETTKKYITQKYKAKKFIAYFQNYTNTFMPLEQFRNYVYEAAQTSYIVEISISTRPDCIQTCYLDVLKEVQEQFSIAINIELGLQSVNYHTLDFIERGHSLAEYLDAVLLIKLHSLYIAKNTKLCKQYEDGTIRLCTKEEYLNRLITFLEYLSPDIVVERLFSRVPEEDAVFSNWETSWWKLQDELIDRMTQKDSYQGKKYDYLNGSAFKKLL